MTASFTPHEIKALLEYLRQDFGLPTILATVAQKLEALLETTDKSPSALQVNTDLHDHNAYPTPSPSPSARRVQNSPLVHTISDEFVNGSSSLGDSMHPTRQIRYTMRFCPYPTPHGFRQTLQVYKYSISELTDGNTELGNNGAKERYHRIGRIEGIDGSGRGGGGNGGGNSNCPRGSKFQKRSSLSRITNNGDVEQAQGFEENDFYPAGIIDESGSAEPVPERQSLNNLGSTFLTELAKACTEASTGDLSLSVAELFHNILGGNADSVTGATSSMMAVDSLENLVERCIKADDNVLALNFIHMLNCIQLRNKVISITMATHRSSTSVMNSVKCSRSVSTIYRYVREGGKYTILANAGSIFLLAAVTVAKIRSLVQDAQITTDVLMKINHVIRCPDPTSIQGKLVINQIIPAIAHMRQQYRFTFSTMFNQPLLLSRTVLPEIEMGDLGRSDEFFDSLVYNTFLKYRSRITWSSCYTPLPTTISPISYDLINHTTLTSTPLNAFSIPAIQPPTNFQDHPPPAHYDDHNIEIEDEISLPTPDIFYIDTAYNPKDNHNTKFDFTRGGRKRTRYRETQAQRKCAKKAKISESLDDLSSKLKTLLRSGFRQNPNNYIFIPKDIVANNRLAIRDAENRPLIIVLSDMPKDLKEKALLYLQTVFPGRLKESDSEPEAEHYSYESIHFSWYNRYSKRGHGIPPNIEPAAHCEQGKRPTKTPNCMPITSTEHQTYMPEYVLLKKCFQDIFRWIAAAVKQVLPNEYEILAQYADVLPANGLAPAYPFTGFVINFNVTTTLHRDWKDLKFCVVMVLSQNCEGGDICFVEPGIRLELGSGDIVLFRSSEISHFNLHFKGLRASIVFHSDHAGEAWVKDRNGWNNSDYINVSTCGEGGDL